MFSSLGIKWLSKENKCDKHVHDQQTTISILIEQ